MGENHLVGDPGVGESGPEGSGSCALHREENRLGAFQLPHPQRFAGWSSS